MLFSFFLLTVTARLLQLLLPPQKENIDLISSQIKRNYNAEPREAGEINNGERCVVFTATALASLLQRKEIFIVRLVCSQLPLLLNTLGKISLRTLSPDAIAFISDSCISVLLTQKKRVRWNSAARKKKQTQ